jgi:hypothetical protein
MSIKARYTGGSLSGVDLSITFKDGDVVQVHVPHGGELPEEVQGRKVPVEYRDSLLEQTDNWSEVKRTDSTSTKKEGDK